MIKALLIALLPIAAVSCTSTGGPSFVVPLGSTDWGEYVLLVYDASSLVANARPAERQPGGATDGVVAVPDRQEIVISWTGGACSHRPVLEITGDSTSLRLIVRNPYDPQPLPFLPIECPAVGIPLGVTLSLTQAVAQDAAEIQVIY